MLLLLLAALGAMIAPSVAHANGRIISYERQTAGPYEIALGTIPESPSVGNLHLSLTVGALSSDAPVPVLDAVVTVVGSGPDALQTEIGPVAVGNSVREPRFYEANVGVDRVGVWTFDIMVASDLGEASATFEVRVQEISLLPGFLTLVVLVALLLILGLSVRSYLRQQRRGKRARAHWDEGRFSRKGVF